MTLGFNIELFLLRLNGDIMEIQIFFFYLYHPLLKFQPWLVQ